MSVNQGIPRVADPVVEESGDLVKLVNQVVESHTPVVVARDGTPIAALVSMEDYARLKQEAGNVEKKLSWDEWLVKRQELHDDILASRGGKPISQEVIDRAWREARQDLEERDSRNDGLGC